MSSTVYIHIHASKIIYTVMTYHILTHCVTILLLPLLLYIDYTVITVLDEADEMLNMGFADDIEEIFSRLVLVAVALFCSSDCVSILLRMHNVYSAIT
jgi:hypothetical protein